MLRLEVATALLVLAATLTISCVEDPSQALEDRQQALTEPCEPPEGYDDCIRVIDEELHHPTDGNAEWRSNESGENGAQLVEFRVDELNAGLIPMAEEQGHYKNEEEFLSRLSSILGFEVAHPEEKTTFGRIVQTGSTLKYAGDPATSEFGAASVGNLICDAMTDENGELWIGGEPTDVECSTNYEIDYQAEGDGEMSSTTTTTAQSLRLDDGYEEIDFNAFKTNLLVYKSIGSEFDNYKRDGKRSRWVYNPCWGWFPCWSKRFVTTSMRLSNTYYHNNRHVPSPGYALFSASDYHSNTDSFKLKEWWVGAGICVDEEGNVKPCSGTDTGPVNTVCAEGSAGGLAGAVGSNSACPSGQW
jgi:hypothetical protein